MTLIGFEPNVWTAEFEAPDRHVSDAGALVVFCTRDVAGGRISTVVLSRCPEHNRQGWDFDSPASRTKLSDNDNPKAQIEPEFIVAITCSSMSPRTVDVEPADFVSHALVVSQIIDSKDRKPA
ncbi:MAG: hypothetical protein QHJ82_01825 [Verrucomicrobiota bacterium]|nr:hypothetical protein [Verrucomicrobiota bacterium]